MFGKTKELNELDTMELSPDDFFGDEEAAEESSRMERLAERVAQVEGQINSQFTSMAAYAQIAQEQVELARSEASTAVNRSERRLVELIERERNDRIQATGSVDGTDAAWASPEVDARLTALESAVAEIRVGLSECLARQKALADAITALFEPTAAPAAGAETLPPPKPDVATEPQMGEGPIAGLSLG
ncbi:MAG: hypothetical protein AAFP84_05410 [Actinomycetota bacterium]